MSPNTVIILTYHSISFGPPPLRISPSLFAQQMDWISRNANVITLSDIRDWLAGSTDLPPRSVALTFDDGFADLYTEAAPVLTQRRLRATAFLPTRFIGQGSSWPYQRGGMTELPLLTWSQIGELAGQEIVVGSHTVNHVDLLALSELEVERECAESKKQIEAHTGRSVQFLCYPYGHWSDAVTRVVGRHYSAACTTALAPVERCADCLSLPRVDAYYLRTSAVFEHLFTRQVQGYLWFRRNLRRMRYGRS